MKICLKTFLAILLIIASPGINGQIRSGYVFGVNLSTMTLKAQFVNPDYKWQPGIHFGGIFEMPVIGNFALQSELLFSAKGTDYKIDTLDYTISPIFIEIPVLAIYSFGTDEFKISFFAGPYVACAVGGNKIEPGGELKTLSFGSGAGNDLKSFDYGFNFGAGVNIRGFVISAQYGIGLADLSPLASLDTEMKNRVIGISISSLLTGK